MTEVHVELLLGKRVHDAKGRMIGRLMSIQAKREGAFCFVTEYHLGAAGLLSRLGISTARMFGFDLKRRPQVIPWQLMDLSDPECPRLKIAIEELQGASDRRP